MTPEITVPSTLLPGIAARGEATAYTDTLWAPLLAIDERLGEFVVGIEDLGEAAGPVLDLIGDWVAEERGGLDDAPYRRLIAGRRVGIEQTVVPGAVFRGWTGLTSTEAAGDDVVWSATIDEYENEVVLIAYVPFMPTTAWVQRVSLVARDLVRSGAYVYGLIAPPGTFRWDLNSFDDAGFGFDFGV